MEESPCTEGQAETAVESTGSKQSNRQTDDANPEKPMDNKTQKEALKDSQDETTKQNNLSPSRAKDSSTKVKRKTRSARRRINAMMNNNSSLHFSDTDSEGELTMMNAQIRSPGKVANVQQQGPVISITSAGPPADGAEAKVNSECLTPCTERSRRNSFTENLTDVDEIFASDTEDKSERNQRNSLTVSDGYQGETDIEDFEGEENEVQVPIYVTPRTDIFRDFNGETITTKEGNGPFSVEIRNKMSKGMGDKFEEDGARAPDIVVMPNTDSEDIEVSDEEYLRDAACSAAFLEDLDVLAGSQIVMKNVNKIEQMLAVKETTEENIGDNHTDVEDVDD